MCYIECAHCLQNRSIIATLVRRGERERGLGYLKELSRVLKSVSGKSWRTDGFIGGHDHIATFNAALYSYIPTGSGHTYSRTRVVNGGLTVTGGFSGGSVTWYLSDVLQDLIIVVRGLQPISLIIHVYE